MQTLTTFVSISSNRLWALLGLCLIHLCFPLNLDSVLCLTGVLMFKTSLFLSPQVLAIVIRSHIFHMHLVTLLLKDKTTHDFSPGSRSAITTTIYCKNITNNGEVMKYHMVSYVWRIDLYIRGCYKKLVIEGISLIQHKFEYLLSVGLCSFMLSRWTPSSNVICMFY